MDRLRVDTDALDAARTELTQVERIAQGLDAGGGRLAAMVPAVGRHRAAQAVAGLDAWTYATGWIGTQAGTLAAQLAQAGAAYTAVEAQLIRAAGGSAAPVQLPAAGGPAAEPVRANWALLAPLAPAVPVQLGSATHVTQLIPGDPGQVRVLARSLKAFAEEMAEARSACARITLGAWVGAAADTVVGQLEELLQRLAQAEAAFSTAGDALAAYGITHTDAQALAAEAMRDFQAAQHADAVARGAVVAGTGGPMMLPSGLDPQVEMNRAVVLWREVEAMMENAERTLVAALEPIGEGAPTDPGLMAQFTLGFAEGFFGIPQGFWAMGQLAVRLSPNRLMWDPRGLLDDQEAFWGGVGQVLTTNPLDTAKVVFDAEMFNESKARWAGRLTPEMLAAIFTVGTAMAAGRGGAFGRLRSIADAKDLADENGGVYPRMDIDDLNNRLDELGHPIGSPARQGAELQLMPHFGASDFWIQTTLQPGQRVAVIGDYVIPADALPRSSRELLESLQLPPARHWVDDGPVSQPMHPESLQIFEVQTPVDAARAEAVMNPQFGAGEGTKMSVGDFDALLDDRQIAEVRGPEGVHRFDPDSLESRIEDPEFRAIDESLPDQALDPDREGAHAGLRAGGEEARNYPIGPAVTAAADHLAHDEPPEPVRHPEHQGAP